MMAVQREYDVWDSTRWHQLGTQVTNRCRLGVSARGHSSLVVYDNKMWVLGGFDSAPNRKSDVWYSTDGRRLGAGQQMMQVGLVAIIIARSSYDGKMWVLGGYDRL